MISALLLIALAQVPGAPPGADNRNRVNSRFRFFGSNATAASAGCSPACVAPQYCVGTTCTDPAPSLVADYEWPYTGADRYPACTDDATCVAACYIGAVDAGTTLWQCKDHSGAALGTVTDPGTATVIRDFTGGYAPVITGATAPKVNTTAITTALDNGAAHTEVYAGYGRIASLYSYWFAKGAGDGYFQAYENSGDLTVIDYVDPTVLSASSFLGSYGIFAHWFDGANAYKAYLQIATTATASLSTPKDTWVNDDFYFGTRSARDLGLNGPMSFWALYATKKTDAQVAAIIAKYFGSYTTANPGVLLVGNGQPLGLDNTATTGNVDMMFPGSNIVNADGLHAASGFTNVWAANALALAGATDVGTPTVNANVSSGPFAAWNNAAECDELVTANALALDGKQSAASAGTDLTYYNQSAYLKAGLTGVTKTKATLALVTDGTFPDGGTAYYCPVTGLTSTAQRFECQTLVSGSPTFVKGQVLVGNAIPDVGSVQVCQAQTTKSLELQPPVPDNTTIGNVYYTTAAVSAWPASGVTGKVELIHTPGYNPNVTWVDATSAYYVLDATTAADADHAIALIFGYTVPGRLNAVIRGPAGEVGDLLVDGISLTPGQRYATAIEWVSQGGGLCKTYVLFDSCGVTPALSCHASTVVGSDVTGAAKCPATVAKLTLANRFNNAFATTTTIDAVRVYQ